MTGVWALAVLWLALALIASLISTSFPISIALSEIIIGALAHVILAAMIGPNVLGITEPRVKVVLGLVR
jgi:glutathione-regulated potassium-efflux system ancillary protein KefC